MLAKCGWTLLTRWRSTNCIVHLHCLDPCFGFPFGAPWPRASDTQAVDHAGHLRQEGVGGVPEVLGGTGRRSDRASVLIGARDDVLFHRVPVRLLLCPEASAPLKDEQAASPVHFIRRAQETAKLQSCQR